MARQVGYALHANPKPGIIPCHRVVNREGRLSGAFAFGGLQAQQKLLEAEGVEVIGPFALSYIWAENGDDFIPESVRKIDRYAFWSTSIFPSLTIPEGVEEIGYRCFQGAWIPEIIMYCSNADIDPDAFEDAQASVIKR